MTALAGILLITAFLSGCELINKIKPPAETATVIPTEITTESKQEDTAVKTPSAPDPESEQTLSTSESADPTEVPATAEPTPEVHTISLWIPPQFDPEQETNGGKALSDALAAYTAEHPNLNIVIRIKAVSGDSSMLNTITAANHIAPDVLPSLALISRSDMETAVQRGLLQPITTSVFSDSSTWYGYARQSAVIDNTVYGLPVLGDGLVLSYRIAKIGAALTDWTESRVSCLSNR